MPREKYKSIILREIEAFVFIILEIFFETRALLNIGEYHSFRSIKINRKRDSEAYYGLLKLCQRGLLFRLSILEGTYIMKKSGSARRIF